MNTTVLFFTAMQVASNAFADAVKEIYEPDWIERDSLVNLFEVCMCFLNLMGINLFHVVVPLKLNSHLIRNEFL